MFIKTNISKNALNNFILKCFSSSLNFTKNNIKPIVSTVPEKIGGTGRKKFRAVTKKVMYKKPSNAHIKTCFSPEISLLSIFKI